MQCLFPYKKKFDFVIKLITLFGFLSLGMVTVAECSDSVTLDPVIVTAKSTEDEYQTGDVNTDTI